MIRHNIILTGTGGTCKTRTAVYLASYYKSKELEVQNFDTENFLEGFTHFKDLAVEKIMLHPSGEENRNLTIENWVKRLADSNCDTITDIGNCDYRKLLKFLEDNNSLNLLAESHNHEIYYHVPFNNCMDKEYVNFLEERLLGSATKNTHLVCWEHFFDKVKQLQSEDEESLYKVPTIKIPCFSELELLQLDNALKYGFELNNQDYINKLLIVEKSRFQAISRKIYSAIDEVFKA